MAKLIKSTQYFVVRAIGFGDDKIHVLDSVHETDLEARKAAHAGARDFPKDRLYVTRSTSGFTTATKTRKVVIGG